MSSFTGPASCASLPPGAVFVTVTGGATLAGVDAAEEEPLRSPVAVDKKRTCLEPSAPLGIPALAIGEWRRKLAKRREARDMAVGVRVHSR